MNLSPYCGQGRGEFQCTKLLALEGLGLVYSGRNPGRSRRCSVVSFPHPGGGWPGGPMTRVMSSNPTEDESAVRAAASSTPRKSTPSWPSSPSFPSTAPPAIRVTTAPSNTASANSSMTSRAVCLAPHRRLRAPSNFRVDGRPREAYATRHGSPQSARPAPLMAPGRRILAPPPGPGQGLHQPTNSYPIFSENGLMNSFVAHLHIRQLEMRTSFPQRDVRDPRQRFPSEARPNALRAC